MNIRKKTYTQGQLAPSVLFIVYIALYFLSYLMGRTITEFVIGLKIDDDKVFSGILIGLFVSIFPFLLLGWRYKMNNPDKIRKVAINLIIISFVLEKIILPFFLYLLIKTDITYQQSDDIINAVFLALSEELPYFIFEYWYIFLSTLISILSFYIGVKLSK